jgi:hypothetical protein
LPDRGPGRRRHDTPTFGMPAGKKLPAVTKNKNYPQPVKHLKPMALGFDRLFRGPAKADRELMHAIRETGAILLCANTGGVSAGTGYSDDALAEVHQVILAGVSA